MAKQFVSLQDNKVPTVLTQGLCSRCFGAFNQITQSSNLQIVCYKELSGKSCQGQAQVIG